MKNTSRLAFILPPDWFSVQWSLKIKENVVGSKSSHPIFRKKPWRLSEALGFSTTSRMLLMFFSASWKTYSQILRSCFLIKVQGSCLSIFDLSCRSIVVPCVDNLWKHHLGDFAKRPRPPALSSFFRTKTFKKTSYYSISEKLWPFRLHRRSLVLWSSPI